MMVRWMLLMLSMMGLVSCSVYDVNELEFEDYAAMSVGSDLLPTGWVPSIVPLSAKDIHIKRDMSNGLTLLRFAGKADIDAQLKARCLVAPSERIAWPWMTARWWPEGFERPNDYFLATHTFYYCDPFKAYFAVHREKDAAFMWRV